MHIRIIMVEPREAGNVGAAARAMKNFGIHDLWIAGPRPQRNDQVSEWWARGASDLVSSVRRVNGLEEALVGSHFSVATTAVRAREVRDPLHPQEIAGIAAARLAPDETIAIVFGREESGLTQAEIALCQRTATIPTDPAFPTMNLAQSVALFCWEMRKASAAVTHEIPAEERLPPAELVHHFRSHARELLENVGFLEGRSAGRVMAELSAIADRALLSKRETSLLLALIRRLELRLGLRSDSHDR